VQPNLIEANGKLFKRRAGFVCDAAQTGDMICQFVGVDFGLAVRRKKGSYHLVGRVDMMDQNLPNDWRDISQASELFSSMMLTAETFDDSDHITFRLTAIDIPKLARPNMTSMIVKGYEQSSQQPYSCLSWVARFWQCWMS
jgi:hypothetical protein